MVKEDRKNRNDILRVGVVQMAPVWLNREKTLTKILKYVDEAIKESCQLIVFNEALLPGYPFWLELTDGARFNSPIQKEIHAHYVDNAVQIEAGHLKPLCEAAADGQISIYVGCIERPPDRGGHSIYCSLVYIDNNGIIQSVHRKLMPTYEERLTWAQGDGHGLRVHKLGSFTLGGLNCWENWMPLARASLYALGEDLHVAVWPGNLRNTIDTTPFIAKESRSFVIASSGIMRKADIPPDTPHADLILKDCPEILANGGSCIAAPDGEWVIEPVVEEDRLLVAKLDHKRVREERQNFDPAGHYSRPDVTRLTVDRRRQSTLSTID